ncbi:unnamed protein product [Gordionus sp. m RMFG-2023]|uniref:general transcription factor IIH subunit 3-like n=1 Tax=Gordionus sp. m RMFG-2023 TaxID=3053472 RepID=UPI0030DFAC04
MGLNAEDNFNLLSIIIDLNELYWGNLEILSKNNKDNFLLNDFVLTIISFSNAYLINNPLNHLNIIATSTSKTKILFNSLHGIKFTNSSIELTNTYTNFQYLHKLKDITISNVKEMFTNVKLNSTHGTLIAAPVLQALSIMNKFEKQISHIGQKSMNRILIIKTEGDAPNQYIDLMNAIFAAQKMNVMIDGCILGKDSDIIHQATFMTDGKYFKLHNSDDNVKNVFNATQNGDNDIIYNYSLLEYLFWLYLPNNNEFRSNFILPREENIDFRAICFCHKDNRKHLDIGFVCSSCLAVFCSFTPICTMCNVHFKIPK